MRRFLLLFMALLANGCVVKKSGRTHHFIFGFGIVSVSNTNEHAAKIVHSRALGIAASAGNFNMGWSSTITTHINTNQNLLIEVNRSTIHVP